MPDQVCFARPYNGFNPIVMVGHKVKYDSNGGGAAGTYRASIIVPAYCYLVDVQLHGISLWTGSAGITGIVGDADDPDGFFTSRDLKATDLLANQSLSVAAGTALAGGGIGAYIASSRWTIGSGAYARYTPVARTITFLVTAAGTATAGETHFLVLYTEPSGREPLGTPVYTAT
jgi:hypothetical protein